MLIPNNTNTTENGYEDIENLHNQTNQLYDKQLEQQKDIVNTSTEQAINEIEKKKQEIEDETTKTNRALYTDYQKQINPYGVNAENLAEQGLNNSGMAESTQLGYYNSYQNARTEARNNANKIKADFDMQIAKARQDGDLQLAQSVYQMYTQKIEDLYNIYNLKFNKEQFNYNKTQDSLAQSNWEKEYQQSLQQAQWQQQFNKEQFDYQKEQDKLKQSNWEKEFELAKKNSSISNSKNSSGGSNVLDLNVLDLNNTLALSEYAQSLYNSYNNILFKAQKGGVLGKTAQAMIKSPSILAATINSEYQQGKITKTDVEILCNKLGLG